MNTASIPPIGWLVIAFIATLLFIILMTKGLRFGWGDKRFAIGQVDKKLNAFIAKENQNRKDNELRKILYRKSIEIDEKTKADERRTIRLLNTEIQNLFKVYTKCSMPSANITEKIKDIFEERVDYNSLRARLTQEERAGYVSDILYYIEKDYAAFLEKVNVLPCGSERYPDWKTIQPEMAHLTTQWAQKISDIIVKRCKEKIKLYQSKKEKFLLEENRLVSIDEPIRKNKKYIEQLGG